MKTISRLMIAVFAILGIAFTASEASAAPNPVNPPGVVSPLVGPQDFALACDLNSTARSRVDFDNIDSTLSGDKVDADDIWYRSLKPNNTANTFTPDYIEVQVYDNDTNLWLKWTSRGGSIGDGVSYPASGHWDPAAKLIVGSNFDHVRAKFWSLGGDSCTSPSVDIG